MKKPLILMILDGFGCGKGERGGRPRGKGLAEERLQLIRPRRLVRAAGTRRLPLLAAAGGGEPLLPDGEQAAPRKTEFDARLLGCHRAGVERLKHMPQQRQCNSLV